MPPSHGRQSIRLVRTRIFGIANAYQRLFKKADHGCQNLLSGQSFADHVRRHTLSQRRKGGGELHDVFVFRLVAKLAPFRMIAILLATAGVEAGGLDMPIADRADPDLFIRRRNADGLDTTHNVLAGDTSAVLVPI